MLDPRSLQSHYSDFLSSSERILLTGHSHQAWPNQARKGIIQTFEDAALYVDDKWDQVFKKTNQVRHFIAQYCHAQADEIALGQNTHELFTRFLSALPLETKPKIVVSTGEFHSVYRQLVAFQKANPLLSTVPTLVWVDDAPASTLAERLAQEVDSTCSAVICSTVLFQNGAQVPHLQDLASICTQHEVRLFLDAYHSFQATQFDLSTFHPHDLIYLSGGGYKYAQWGEGACWLRIPTHDTLKPTFTGWFSDFEHLHEPRQPDQTLKYSTRPADRFAGSTFDPTSWYRAQAVIEFFEEHNLTLPRLRTLSLAQTDYLIEHLSPYFELLTPSNPEERGGFVAFKVKNAHQWTQMLREKDVWVDSRGESLRFGPAPYISFEQLHQVVDLIKTLV